MARAPRRLSRSTRRKFREDQPAKQPEQETTPAKQAPAKKAAKKATGDG